MQTLGPRLTKSNQKLSSAESITGGSLGAALTATPGASGWYSGGVVTYATELKRSLLKVTSTRVVSAQCAEEMAQGVRNLVESDWAISTTGVAGPEGQDGMPVGTLFVAVAGPDQLSSREFRFDSEQVSRRGPLAVREWIRARSVEAALGYLEECLS